MNGKSKPHLIRCNQHFRVVMGNVHFLLSFLVVNRYHVSIIAGNPRFPLIQFTLTITRQLKSDAIHKSCTYCTYLHIETDTVVIMIWQKSNALLRSKFNIEPVTKCLSHANELQTKLDSKSLHCWHLHYILLHHTAC